MTFAEVGTLFAQSGDDYGGGGAGGGAAGAGGALLGFMMMAVWFVFAIGMIVAYIMYFLTLSKALQQCSSRNRTMEPGMVWLNLIPCFNFVWFFITVSRVAESLKNEFEDRGMRSDGDYGKGIGITTYVLLCCIWIPFLNWLVGPAYLICWIIYWVKIAGLSKQLREGGGERAEDEEDERPSRRRAKADDDDEDEGERPSRRRAKADEDEDERPSRRRRNDDEEDERPSRRRRDDDEEDERPSRRRRDDD